MHFFLIEFQHFYHFYIPHRNKLKTIWLNASKICMASNTVDQNRNGRLAAMSTSHLKSEEAFKMQAGKLSAFSDSYDVDA